MSFFKIGDTVEDSAALRFLVDCSTLTETDYDELAIFVSKSWAFKEVFSASDAAETMAECLAPFSDAEKSDVTLIVDTLYVSGQNMEKGRARAILADVDYNNVRGVVLFAYTRPPDWITPVFSLYPTWNF